MRILQKLVLDCDPDAAWRAVHSPAVFAELYGPLLTVRPLSAGPFPVQWEHGQELAVRMSVGPVPLGTQLIHLVDRTVADARGSEARIVRDAGIPLTGPLASLAVWDHQMAVAPLPGDPARTLWRERLALGGGAAPILWPVFWAVWQTRAARLRRLARHLAFEPAEDEG
jgi:hypothetical protein